MPGWMTLWRGWSQLQIMVAVVADLKPPSMMAAKRIGEICKLLGEFKPK